MPQPKVQTAGKCSAEPGSRESRSEGALEKGEGELKSEGDGRGEAEEGGGIKTDGKGDKGVRVLVKVLGPLPSFLRHTGVWISSPSLAKHLGLAVKSVEKNERKTNGTPTYLHAERAAIPNASRCSHFVQKMQVRSAASLPGVYSL